MNKVPFISKFNGEHENMLYRKYVTNWSAQKNPRCCACWPGSDIPEGPDAGEF